VLAKANRITSGTDYKAVVRRGSRIVRPNTVMYVRRGAAPGPSRFGFIVAKNVGNAVTRNRVRRRLKAATSELTMSVPAGTDIVIRALPSAATAEWATLRAEIAGSLAVAGERR
jgi:ribonuclease P protein component